MKFAFEVFGISVRFEIGGGTLSLTAGRLLDVLYMSGDGTRGRTYFDRLSHGYGNVELWAGGRHLQLVWGPAWNRRPRSALA